MTYIDDILESIELIFEYTKDISENDFSQNQLIQDAVCRRIEIIGESVKNIPSDVRLKYNIIPWKKIAGMRDILTHAYFNVIAKRIWNVIINDLSSLKQQVLEIKQEPVTKQ
ncbi:MAG: HepT-like ribonuclease domain-containing protein [Promethearchaeota archaeon]